MSRGVRPNQQQTPVTGEPQGTNHNTSPNKGGGIIGKIKGAKWANVASIALLFSVTIVVVALVFQIVLSDSNREGKFVEKDKLQAVFLNNGQVYFGDITEMNENYVNMTNIYYLRVNQQVQPGQQATQNDVSLVKLGCELHGPKDLMTINREQITFWENLKDDGQVAKAVAEYVKQNPNGQNCEQQAQQAAPAPSSSDGASNESGSNTPNSSNNANNGSTGTTNNNSGSTNQPGSSQNDN